MNRILLIDNYDSFVYNVLHLLRSSCSLEADIVFNDRIPFDKLNNYSHIVISPGPGIPSEAGGIFKVLEQCHKSHTILGICLGHQAIAEYFGAKIYNLGHPLHGHRSSVFVTDINDPVLGRIKDDTGNTPEFTAGLYHSWAVDPASLPPDLKTGSINETGIVMSLYHAKYPIYGIQFHPESVISIKGDQIINKWLDIKVHNS